MIFTNLAHNLQSAMYSILSKMNIIGTERGKLLTTSDGKYIKVREATGDLVNIGGRYYPVVKIGNQVWITKNLDYAWTGLSVNDTIISTTIPKAYYYNYEQATYGFNGRGDGLLYNFSAIEYLNTNSNTLLPEGWRVPSESDWDTLISEVGGFRIAAQKLKTMDYWENTAGTNDYNFSALPSGIGNEQTTPNLIEFENINNTTLYWTSDTDNDQQGLAVQLAYGNETQNGYYPKYLAFSLRLVQDVT